MKKVQAAMGIILASMFFSACAEKQADSSELEFPGMKWGMGKEEAFKAAGITDEDLADYSSEATYGSAYIVEGYEAFGEKSYRVNFNFLDVGSGEQELCAVFVEYPEDADMDSVLEEMQKAYGDTVPETNVYGQFQVLGDGELSSYDYKETDHLKLWSGASVRDAVAEEREGDYLELWQGRLQPGLNEETWNEFLENANMVTVLWTDDAEGRGNGVSFMAYNQLVYNELTRQLSE